MGKNLFSLNFSLKKILFTLTFTVLFSSQILADDFLAKLTNNALSDYSQGVKKLTPDEASQVVGGYLVRDFGSGNEWYAVALYSSNELQKGFVRFGYCKLFSSQSKKIGRILAHCRRYSRLFSCIYSQKKHSSFSFREALRPF